MLPRRPATARAAVTRPRAEDPACRGLLFFVQAWARWNAQAGGTRTRKGRTRGDRPTNVLGVSRMPISATARACAFHPAHGAWHRPGLSLRNEKREQGRQLIGRTLERELTRHAIRTAL